MGHQPPRPPQAGVTDLPPIAAARTHGYGGGSGPLSAARTRSKNGEDRPEGRHRPADWGVIFFLHCIEQWP